MLNTDASGTGLGAVLYQKQDGKDRVVAYASRSLTKAERNYPAHKLEFLAVKWAVCEKFHDYLYGGKFEVVTDNNPLTYVTTSAKLDATGQRWIAALAAYDFSIRYRKGKNNNDADGLSRISPSVMDAICTSAEVNIPIYQTLVSPGNEPPLNDPTEDIPEDLLQSYSLSNKDWIKAQSDDPQLKELVCHIFSGNRPSSKDSCKHYAREWDKLVV